MTTYCKHIVYSFGRLENRVPMASEQVPVASEGVPVRTEHVPVRTRRVLMRYECSTRKGRRPGVGGANLDNSMVGFLKLLVCYATSTGIKAFLLVRN